MDDFRKLRAEIQKFLQVVTNELKTEKSLIALRELIQLIDSFDDQRLPWDDN